MHSEMMHRAVERHRAGDLAEAARLYRIVLEAHPDRYEALHMLSLIEIRNGNFELAEHLLQRAISADPRRSETYANLAVAQKALSKFEEALANCDRALALSPRDTKALYNRGIVLCALGREEEALASYAGAIAVKPDFAEALNNAGSVLIDLKRHARAIAYYDRLLAIEPPFAEARYNRGLALSYLGRHEDAAADFQHAFELQPQMPFVEGMLLHAKMYCCDWRDFDRSTRRLVRNVRAGKRTSDPLTLLAITDSPRDQRTCAQAWVADKCPATRDALWRGERYRHERIRLAYLSADFREHPTAHLIGDLVARHDRQRFETIAISFGSNADDEMRALLVRRFDRFIDVAHATDREIGELIRSLEIDVAVDLMGFTADARPGVLAFRPAPIQVNYLGFPGTMGAPYVDYIIGDRRVIPASSEEHYAECVAYLPDTFQSVAATRPLSQTAVSRGECGLAEHAFVFCCFNNSYKITPAMFDLWMRVLRQIEQGVLWLVADTAAAQTNLRDAAKARGVDPARLVFATRVAYPQHLARLRLADLFLDTLPFNAGATAADALWNGLPLLTASGEAFASRMAASLLHAVDLGELATSSLQAYEATALRLASEPALLSTIGQKVLQRDPHVPFFDADRFRRHIEAAYVTMWSFNQRGDAPQSFSVEPGA